MFSYKGSHCYDWNPTFTINATLTINVYLNINVAFFKMAQARLFFIILPPFIII